MSTSQRLPTSEWWTVELPMTAPLSLNHRQHHMVRAKKVAEVRQWAKLSTQEARVPALGKVRVTLVYEPRDKRRRDPLNLVATLKPVQDGIVDAGVVPDDTPQYMESPMPLIDVPSGGKHGRLWVLIERII